MKKVLIIYSNFYPEISENLLEGAELILQEKKNFYKKISVDGSLEIPFVLEKHKKNFKGFIILGCVIKGETDHYYMVRDIALKQIYKIAYENKIPLSSAVLTVKNYSQAVERSELEKKNLGANAANVCINLMNLLNE